MKDTSSELTNNTNIGSLPKLVFEKITKFSHYIGNSVNITHIHLLNWEGVVSQVGMHI